MYLVGYVFCWLTMAIINGYLCFCCTCLQKGLPYLAAVTYVEPFVSSTSTGIMVRPQFTPQQRSFLVTEYARTQSVTEVLKIIFTQPLGASEILQSSKDCLLFSHACKDPHEKGTNNAGRITLPRHIMKPMIKCSYFKQDNFKMMGHSF